MEDTTSTDQGCGLSTATKAKGNEEPLRWPDGRVVVMENTVKLLCREWKRHDLLA
jgi:hypothetical protein